MEKILGVEVSSLKAQCQRLSRYNQFGIKNISQLNYSEKLLKLRMNQSRIFLVFN